MSREADTVNSQHDSPSATGSDKRSSVVVPKTHIRELGDTTKQLLPPGAAPNCVTIFGAGVAGLTAAHELVERGFRVQVWDPTFDQRDPSRGCEVGGMARTQWSRVPWGEQFEASLRRDPGPWTARQTTRIRHMPWVFYLGGQNGDQIVGAIGERDAYFRTGENEAANDSGIREIVHEMASSFLLRDSEFDDLVYCEVQHLTPTLKVGRETVQTIIDKLNDEIGAVARLTIAELGENALSYTEQIEVVAEIQLTRSNSPREVRFRIVLLDGFPDGLPAGVAVRISFRVRERWIAGEHGFRFFPAFYRHLFDTMRRTPILEPVPKSATGAAQERAVTVDPNPDKYVESGSTVFDNLRATTKQVIALPFALGPNVLSRSLPKSFEELREWIRLSLQPPPDPASEHKTKGGFGLDPRDVAQFQLRVFQYLTTCDARRKEYEEMSWLDFLGGSAAFSDQFVEVLNSVPRTLVAMDALDSDARTQGTVFAQLLLDNVTPESYRDGILLGPTSVAWLTPWRRYLEAQGVEFIHGRLRGFKAVTPPEALGLEATRMVWPDAECYEPRYPGALGELRALMPGYFLLALPADELRAAAKSFAAAATDVGRPIDADGDIARAARYLTVDDTKLDTPTPTGALRHMIGIQYYFDEDIYWRDGHFYFPSSKWGISAISQARFWQDKHDWEHGYRGVLSVVITVLERPGAADTPESLWTREPAQIAQDVWAEIQCSIGGQGLPEPRYWHIDAGFRRNPADRGYTNETPMLINIPGRWAERPGDLCEVEDQDLEPSLPYSNYAVEQGVVLAGTLMKTHTRLTTMEAANESARHAVNAILQDVRKYGAVSNGSQHAEAPRLTPCEIWPPELHEIEDFRFLKEVDAALHERGLEHFVDILELAELIRTVGRGARASSRSAFDPLSILSQLERTLRSLATAS